MNKKKLFLYIIVGFLAVGVLATLPAYILTPSTPLVTKTIICGSNSAPQLVMGKPKHIEPGIIVFDDGYALALSQAPSFYIDKLAVFQIKNGVVDAYALIDPNADFHPCR